MASILGSSDLTAITIENILDFLIKESLFGVLTLLIGVLLVLVVEYDIIN